MNLEKIEKEIKEKLSPYRYEHSIEVANTAKKLAKHYHIDEDKAYLAGLLHDIAKELSEEENNYYINTYHLPKTLKDEKNKNIRHADIGAVIAKEKYQVTEDIYNAIKYHTIGNKNMDLLAKIIFIADKIGRKNIPTELIPVKELAYQDIDKAMLYLLTTQKNYLQKKGIKMHNDSQELLKKLT